jgi:probable phosphomutase (TIGR03848 family)
MTTLLLIRHGMNDYVGRALAGWTPGVHLNEEGRRQAQALAVRLAGVPIDVIYSSPLERAVETAEPVAERLGLAIKLCDEFGEFRFGSWTGQTFKSLEELPEWKQFNTFRSGTRPPGGELMVEVQQRMVSALEQLRHEHKDKIVAVFTHADAIRATLGHYAGISIEHCLKLDINPASVSVLKVNDWGVRVSQINEIGRVLG